MAGSATGRRRRPPDLGSRAGRRHRFRDVLARHVRDDDRDLITKLVLQLVERLLAPFDDGHVALLAKIPTRAQRHRTTTICIGVSPAWLLPELAGAQ